MIEDGLTAANLHQTVLNHTDSMPGSDTRVKACYGLHSPLPIVDMIAACAHCSKPTERHGVMFVCSCKNPAAALPSLVITSYAITHPTTISPSFCGSSSWRTSSILRVSLLISPIKHRPSIPPSLAVDAR